MSSFKVEAITMIPALVLFVIAIYLSFYSFVLNDLYLKVLLVVLATCLFFGGVVMVVCWVFYWAIYRKLH
jgi:hypothetical protein